MKNVHPTIAAALAPFTLRKESDIDLVARMTSDWLACEWVRSCPWTRDDVRRLLALAAKAVADAEVF